MESNEQELIRLKSASQATFLLASDSHGRLDGIEQLLAQIKRPDLILHCGDHQDPIEEIQWAFEIPVIGVSGNCDSHQTDNQLPPEKLIILAGKRIYLTHGHLQGVKNHLINLQNRAVSQPFHADLICFGHTHHQLASKTVVQERTVFLLNPGSSYPSRTGAQGIYVEIKDKIITYQCLIVAKNP